MKKAILTVFLASIFLISILAGVRAVEATFKTLTVPDDYPTIQTAIDKASAGDTVFVKKGAYSSQALIVDKPISLVGEDVKTTILRGNNLIFPQMSITLQVKSDNVSVSGFTFTHDTYAISGGGDRIKLSSNAISGIVSLGGSSITIEYNNCSSIQCSGVGNTVFGNTLNFGIEIGGSFNNVSSNNIISGSYSKYNCGIEVDGNSNFVSNNKLQNGGLGIAINHDGIPNTPSSNNIISENNITGHTFEGIWVYKGHNNTFVKNYIADNGWGITIGGFHFESENNIIYHNNFVNNSISAKADNSSLYANYWDNGKEGNYWSDYTGADSNNDGLGDTPYVIDDNNKDNYPLMSPSNISTSPPQNPSPTPTPSLIELPYATGNFSPNPNSTNVPLNTTISISFSRPPSICDLNITPNVPIKERIFKAEGFGGTYIFHLSEQLQPQTTYTVTITFGQENASEGFAPTSTRTWNFTTGMPIPIADTEFHTEIYTPAIIICTSIAVVVALAVLFYFKKRRKG